MARVSAKVRREGLRQEAERVRIERDYIRRMRRLVPAFRRKILEALPELDLQPTIRIEKVIAPLRESLLGVAETAFERGYQNTVRAAQDYMRSRGGRLAMPMSFQLEHGGRAIYRNMVGTILGDLEPRLASTVASAVNNGYTGEITIPEAKSWLSTRLDAMGFRSVKPYVIETWITTMVQTSYSAGKAEAAMHPAIDEILWGWEYTTVGDDRVRFEHEGYDGTRYPKNDPFWAVNTPPNGWNCRCSVIEVFDEGTINPPHSVDVNGVEVAPSTDPTFEFSPQSVAIAA